jgi:hypothetical protein
MICVYSSNKTAALEGLITRLVTLCAAAVVLGAGCSVSKAPANGETASDSEPSPSDTDPNRRCPVDCGKDLGIIDALPDDLCLAELIADNARLSHCYTSFLQPDLVWTDPAFEAYAADYCEKYHVIEALEGYPAIDEAVEADYIDCLLAWANAPCGCTDIPGCGDIGTILPSGTLDDGTSCQFDIQCRSGRCDKDISLLFDPWSCGVCASRGGDGAPCDGTLDCDVGDYCNDETGVCTPVKRLCEPCATTGECDGINDCTGGVCTWPNRQEGDDCADNMLGCSPGLMCMMESAETGVCEPSSLVFVGIGEPCNVETDAGQIICDSTGYCDADEDGVCIRLGDEGDPCILTDDFTRPHSCASLLDCVEGTCGYLEVICD